MRRWWSSTLLIVVLEKGRAGEQKLVPIIGNIHSAP
jgi:hypothetical protein